MGRIFRVGPRTAAIACDEIFGMVLLYGMYATGWGILRSAGTGEGEPVDIPFFSQNTSRKELGRREKFGADRSRRFGTYSKDAYSQTHNF